VKIFAIARARASVFLASGLLFAVFCVFAPLSCKPAESAKAGAAAPNTANQNAEKPAAENVGNAAAKPNYTVDINLDGAQTVKILIEAESGKVKPPMAIFEDDPAASGGKYVKNPADHPEGSPDHNHLSKAGEGSVALPFTVKEAGKYELWLRVWWCCGCGNSFALDITDPKAPAGKRIRNLGEIENGSYRKWQWMRWDKGQLDLAAGDYTLTVTNTEDGARLDQVLLVKDSSYIPGDAEKP
jgi:hypothetical protein